MINLKAKNHRYTGANVNVPALGDIIRVGRLDYKVISTQLVSERVPNATSGLDNLIIKATKPNGKKVFEIIQYPSGKFSNAVGR